jgi:hypothetical protein
MKAQYEWSEIDVRHNLMLKTIRREKALYRFIDKAIPKELRELVTYYFDNIGDTVIRVFLEFNEGVTAEQIQPIFPFGAKLKQDGWKFSKFFRQDAGTFAYRIAKSIRGIDYNIFFEDAPDVDGCVIKKKTEVVEKYYSDCGELEKTF